MAGKKIGLVLALDGEGQYTQGVQNIRKETALLNTELKGVTHEFENNANSLEALQKKQELLIKSQDAYQRKVTASKDGLENANKKYREQSERLEELKKKLEEARKAQQKMDDAGDTSTKAYEDQVKAVKELEDAVEKQTLNRQKAAGRITDWNKRVAESENELKKANKALEQNEKYLKEAEQATDHCATSIDAMGKAVDQAEQKMADLGKTEKEVQEVTTTLGDKLTSAFVEKGTSLAMEAISEGAEKLKESMYDISGASASLQASTGASATAMNKYNAVMKEVKGNNFGESYAEVAEAMGVVIQTMGDLDDIELQNVTENAMTLQDTFGYDYQESLRAVDMLMQQFGISSEEAFNLIVQGTQQGLNKNGDLLDTINEYSVHYAQMGTSAEGFFNSLANGTEAGTFSVDKLGDAYKEFGIRVKDTATSTDEAYSLLGLNADYMRSMFAAGGESAAEATDIVLASLMSMDDKVAQNQAGVDLFGTMWEDLGITGVQALTNLEGGISSAKTAMDSLKEVKYSDLESAVSGLGAAIEENITTPIAETAIPLVTGLFKKATGIISGLGDAIAPQKTELQTFVDEIKASNDEVDTLLEKAKSTISGADNETANLEAYKNTLLALNEETSKTEFQKFQIKQIVSELSGSIPELASAFDEETGSIKLTNEEISRLISNQQDLIMQQAYAKASQEAYEGLATAQLNAAKAQSALEQAEKARADYLAEDAKRAEDIANGNAALKVTEEINNLNTAVTIAQKEFEKANEAVGEAQGIIDITEDALQDLTKAEEENAVASDAEAQKQEQLAMRRREASEAATAGAVAAEEESAAIEKAAEAAEAGAEAQRNAAKSIVDAYHGYVSEITSDLQDKISLFEKFDAEDGGEDLSVEAMTENLNSQIEAYQEYEKNLAEVRDHVGKEIAPEFMQYLEGMGMEGANTLKHIIATFEENEPEKVKEMSDKWVEAMNMTEGIAEVNAANKLAYEAAIGELGSSDADFSALRESVDSAVTSAAEGWQNLPDETRTSLNEAISAAQECGVQIPEGLTEGILNGETSPESAIEQLNGTIQGSFDGLAEVAKELGVSIPPELAAGIEAGGQQAIDAYKSLIGEISAQAGSEFVSNMESTSSDAGTAAGNVAQTAADSMTKTESEFQSAGNKAAQAYVDALNAAKENAAQAGGALGSAAQNAVMAWQNAFYNSGVYMAQGVAQGIFAGQSDAITAAATMARLALQAAKDELEIRSPSKKFRKLIGQNISESTAFGIKDKASLAGKEASKMSNQVYKSAVSWLNKYKKSQKLSVDNEKYYWKQVLKHTKEGTSAYEKAVKKLTAAEIKDDFGVSWYTTKNKKKVKKDAETYYSEVLSAAQDYYEKLTATDDMSLRQQKKYWTDVRNTLKKGTQAWIDAQKKIDAIKARIGTVSNADAVLGAYQTYYDMSEQAVVEYWDTVRQQYEAGTDERLEADQKYFEAKEDLNDKLIDLEEDYQDKVLDIEKKTNDEIEKLNEDYENQLKSRADAIKNAFGMFDEFESESADGKTLLFNMKTQAAGYEDWMNQLDELESKGILNDDLMEELKEQGPDISAAIHALNSLTEEELAEYNAAYLKKMDLSQKQAEEDTALLKQSVVEQTAVLQAQMKADIETERQEYEKRKAEMQIGLSTSMLTLAQNVRLIAEDQTTALVAAIKGEAVREGGESSVGDNVSNSTLSAVGVTSDGLPSTAATSASESEDKILAIINSYPKRAKLSDKELETHSALFKYIYKNYKRKPGHAMYKQLADELGVNADKQPTAKQRSNILKKLKEKGYRSGGRNLLEELIWMDEDLDKIGPEMLVRKADNAILTRIQPGDDVVNAETVSNMAKWAQYSPEIAQEALFKMQEQMMKQQATLKSYADTLNAAGIIKLNDLMNQETSLQNPVQSYGDISRLEGLMASMIDMMAEFLPNLTYLRERQRVVLDKDEVTDRISNELAMRNRRRR